MLAIGAVAGIAGYLIGKNQQKVADKHNSSSAASTTGSLQADGSFNCANADSYTYVACNSYNVSTCASASTSTTSTTATLGLVPSTGVVTGSGTNCAAFNAQYCASTVTAPASEVVQLANGSMEQVGINGQGGGIGTGYCTTSVAATFCTNPTYAAQRANCPSCQNLASGQGAACAANPAACMAQNSIAQLQAARTTCPTDPIFSNPAYASLLGTSTGTATTTTGSTTVLTGPAVLPASSAARAAASQMAAADLPTDVGGQYGPSLFASSSQAIRQMCQLSHLNNCQ